MRYTFFEIENFRGIHKTRIDLTHRDAVGRVFTLVGLNESGKTTVLEAIDLFQGTDDADPSPKELGGWVAPDHHTLIPIAERTNFNGKVIVRCGIELDDEDVVAASGHLREFDGFRLSDINRSIVIADEYSFENSKFERRKSIWHGLTGRGTTKKGRTIRAVNYSADKTHWVQLTKFIRARLPKIWYFPDFLFEFPDRIDLEETAKETKINRFYRTLFQDILDALGRDLAVSTHVIQRAQSTRQSDRDNLRQVLLEAGRHVTDSVVAAWNEMFQDNPMSQKRVQIELLNGPGTEDGPAPGVSVSFVVEDSEGFFSVRERSRGFRWFFVYLLITTYRGARRGASTDMLFLFDEPASNLHSTAQSALLSSFEELSKKAVIVYTTHSHHLIEPAWLGTTYVVANHAIDPREVSPDVTVKRTDIQVTPYRRFAAQHPDQRHYFQPILDVLKFAPSRLELVPGVVMLEGKSDYYLLRYFQDVVMELPPEASLPLLPGGGSGTLDDVIQLYLAWSRPFVALLDSDKAGRSETKRYTDKFGDVVAPHFASLATVSGRPAARAIEGLLEEEDKLTLQRVVDPESGKYSKATLALGVQEALVRKKKVGLSRAASQALKQTLVGLRAQMEALG